MDKISAYAQLIKTRLANGKYPIGIFTNLNGKSKPQRSGYSCNEADWNLEKMEFKSTYPNYKLANEHLKKLIAEAKAPYQKADIVGAPVVHISKRDKKEAAKVVDLDFVRYMFKLDGVSPDAPEVKPHAQSQGIANRIKLYCGSITMDKMTMAWLREFRQWSQKHRIKFDNKTGVASIDTDNPEPLEQNTTRSHEKWIRKYMKVALAEGLISNDPWGNNKHKLKKEIIKDVWFMEKEERERFVALLDRRDEMTKYEYKTLAYCLLGVFSGLRQVDWHNFLKEDRVQNGGRHFFLRATKNQEMVVIPIGPTLKRVIELIQECGEPPCEYHNMLIHIKKLFKLANIKPGKKHGTHSMRHSFGRLLAEQEGIDLFTAADLLGDTPEMTKRYFHRTGKLISAKARVLEAI